MGRGLREGRRGASGVCGVCGCGYGRDGVRGEKTAILRANKTLMGTMSVLLALRSAWAPPKPARFLKKAGQKLSGRGGGEGVEEWAVRGGAWGARCVGDGVACQKALPLGELSRSD